MKELKELSSAAQPSGFLGAMAKTPAGSSIALFAVSSGAMFAGHVGTILSIDYEVVQGQNIPDLTADQTIQVDNETYLIQPMKDPNTGKPNKPKAPTIKFDTGRTMTLGLLLQGQGKTTVTFKSGVTVKAPDFKTNGTGEDSIANLIGKKLRCDSYIRDTANPIVRNAGSTDKNNPERSYPANVYTFSEV